MARLGKIFINEILVNAQNWHQALKRSITFVFTNPKLKFISVIRFWPTAIHNSDSHMILQ